MSRVINAQTMLKKREAWKYADVQAYLRFHSIKHEFEFIVGEFFIYDLVLYDYRILIEFDGSCHDNRTTRLDDFEKDNIAEDNGYIVERIKVDDNLVIPADDVALIISRYKPL